jgi:hypothetical protein
VGGPTARDQAQLEDALLRPHQLELGRLPEEHRVGGKAQLARRPRSRVVHLLAHDEEESEIVEAIGDQPLRRRAHAGQGSLRVAGARP